MGSELNQDYLFEVVGRDVLSHSVVLDAHGVYFERAVFTRESSSRIPILRVSAWGDVRH